LQLDDWVLCRIYNKRGSVEKYYGADQDLRNLTEIDERKPKIMVPTKTMITDDQIHMDTSDSVPKLHTDSSCSEHVVSPEFTCEREVQSEAKWSEVDNYFGFNYNMDDGFSDDPFGRQLQFQMDQLSPLQDMFAYLQQPL
jgi:hypothetical protein